MNIKKLIKSVFLQNAGNPVLVRLYMSVNYKGVDYFNLDSLLSEEEKMVRETAREFVNNEVLPVIEKHNKITSANKLRYMGF